APSWVVAAVADAGVVLELALTGAAPVAVSPDDDGGDEDDEDIDDCRGDCAEDAKGDVGGDVVD
ncbi:MAG: hypothetical protein M1815_001207, partial [Lichina confinis]